MERRKEVQEAIDNINSQYQYDFRNEGRDWYIVRDYIQSLEMMVDTAYKTLEELDETV